MSVIICSSSVFGQSDVVIQSRKNSCTAIPRHNITCVMSSIIYVDSPLLAKSLFRLHFKSSTAQTLY